jgi:formate dehydrogenase subunit gamma
MPPDAVTPAPASASTAIERPLPRFDRVERTVHWVNATLFGVLMLTGAALYAGPISTLVGHRDVVRNIHVYSGLALPLPLIAAVIGPRGARLRRDLGRLNRWTRDDARWFRRKLRPHVRLGKFNPGQKLNAAFVAGAGVVMLATGSIMHWFSPFPVDWRTGATFVHDWFALGIWVAVLGHVWFAVRDGDALESMFHGQIPERWARRHAPRWYDETKGTPARETPASDALGTGDAGAAGGNNAGAPTVAR